MSTTKPDDVMGSSTVSEDASYQPRASSPTRLWPRADDGVSLQNRGEEDEEEKEGQPIGSVENLKTAIRALRLALRARTLRGEAVHVFLALAWARCLHALDRLSDGRAKECSQVGLHESSVSLSLARALELMEVPLAQRIIPAERAVMLLQVSKTMRAAMAMMMPAGMVRVNKNDSPRTSYLRKWCAAVSKSECRSTVEELPISTEVNSDQAQERQALGSVSQVGRWLWRSSSCRQSDEPSNSLPHARGQGGHLLGRVLSERERQECMVEAGNEIGSLTWVKGEKVLGMIGCMTLLCFACIPMCSGLNDQSVLP
jgi:hypothetical protein